MLTNLSHRAAVATYASGSELIPTAANDNRKAVSDAAAHVSNEDDLDRTEAWIRVELADGDVDLQAMTEDLMLVQARLLALRGPGRRKARLHIAR